ncbi:MAG: hypothetical protein JW854_14305 [Actinobacteria bacterium]|nr:hypothetical protein [Actinomycetota bacterium]
MKGFKKHIAATLLLGAVLLACAFLAVSYGVPASSPAVGEGRDGADAASASLVHPDDLSPGMMTPRACQEPRTEEIAAAPAAAVAAEPGATETREPEETPQEPEETPQGPDEPNASAVDPSLPAPTDFTATFNYGVGQRRSELTWTAVSYPGLTGYVLARWAQNDFASMLDIFQQLAASNPAAAPCASDLQAQFLVLYQGGLTYTEKNATMDAIEADVDQLFTILFSTPGTGSLVQQLVALADTAQTTNTYYYDNSISDNIYYLYIAVANYNNGDTSAPSNSGGVFSVRPDRTAPATPTGFTATAYDPGVALEWDRNTEADLAGYDVFVMQGGSPVQLNPSLITTGTEFFYEDIGDAGGTTYRVRAVDLRSRRSGLASAVSVLAPATYYYADDPAWVCSGSWDLEDYRAIETSGGLLWVGHWGEVPPPDPPYSPPPVPTYTQASASLQFTGRRVRVYSARYWACGNVNFYIDGELEDTFNLYYDGGYTNGTYIPPLWQQRSFQITGLSKGPHTLIIEAAGSGGAQGQHFVNFEYAESR